MIKFFWNGLESNSVCILFYFFLLVLYSAQPFSFHCWKCRSFFIFDCFMKYFSHETLTMKTIWTDRWRKLKSTRLWATSPIPLVKTEMCSVAGRTLKLTLRKVYVHVKVSNAKKQFHLHIHTHIETGQYIENVLQIPKSIALEFSCQGLYTPSWQSAVRRHFALCGWHQDLFFMCPSTVVGNIAPKRDIHFNLCLYSHY